MLTVKITKSDVTPAKWSEIEKSLELPAGRDEVIVTRIPGLLPVEAGMSIDISVNHPDEWLIGESVDGHRQYVIHTSAPRFICEAVDDENDKFNPPFEYQTADGQWLCNFMWLDNPPEDLTILCHEAEEALKMYDENLGI